MNKIKRLSNPLDHVLNCYENNISPTKFDILNAKDELSKIKEQIEKLMEAYINSRTNAREDRSRWLSAEQDRAKLSEENELLKQSLSNVMDLIKVSDRGDLNNTKLQYNHYIKGQMMLPFHSNNEEVEKVVDGLKERLTS